MTPAQENEFNDFFEHTRLMRVHQIAYEQSRYTSQQDKQQANYYKKKVDAYIKLKVKLIRTKQAEIF